MNPILYDTTLRDGTQREGLSLSAEDKVRIACRLDALGIGYIEGGWPGSNPKDAEFFRRIAGVPLRQAKIAAFGDRKSTRLNSSHDQISYAVFCLKKKKKKKSQIVCINAIRKNMPST